MSDAAKEARKLAIRELVRTRRVTDALLVVLSAGKSIDPAVVESIAKSLIVSCVRFSGAAGQLSSATRAVDIEDAFKDSEEPSK